MILALGPMAGFTNAPFRKICMEMGATHTITEMVSAMGLLHAPKNKEPYKHLLYVNENETNAAAQIFGSNPLVMAQAAKVIADLGCFSYIDINMGCPVKKIVGNGEGSALMKNPVLAGKIVESVAKAQPLPVSVKMRIGWDSEHINAVEFAKVLAQSGASMLAVHGRTREQFYAGAANWQAIAQVKQAVNIPVIANGDVVDTVSAQAILDTTRCDGIMLARATMGNPWIFAALSAHFAGKVYTEPSLATRKQTMLAHFEALLAFEGEHKGLAEAKSQLVHYFTGSKNASQARAMLNTAQSEMEVLHLIEEFFACQ